MQTIQIDFLAKISTLLKEIFKFKKYKAMHPALAVFTGILMLPFVVASFAVIGAYACLAFTFAIISSPVKYLHEILFAEGQKIKHLSQGIIYLISWPLVFAWYVVVSGYYIVLNLLYAVISILAFIWSLGGFKFHLFPQCAEDISIEVQGRYKVLPAVYVIVALIVLVLIPIGHGIGLYNVLWLEYWEDQFTEIFFSTHYPPYIYVHILFSILYSLIGFARFPKSEKTPEVEEECCPEIVSPIE
jgi:hypothetical protein